MARAGLAMGRQLKRNFHHAGIPITSQQWQLLVQLWQRNGRTQQELANILSKDKTSITRLVDNLEKSGIVERREDPADRRNRLIFLTLHGQELLQPCFAQAIVTIGEATKGVSEAEMATCKHVLNQIFNNLNTEDNNSVGCLTDENETPYLCGLED